MQVGLYLETLSGKSEMFLEGGVRCRRECAIGRSYGWKTKALSDLLARHTQPMQEHLPRISTAFLLHPHPISDFCLHAFFFSCQYSVQIIRSSVSFPFSACLIEEGG